MFLLFTLLLSTAQAADTKTNMGKPAPKADVQRAIRVVETAPNAAVFNPTPTPFPVDMTTTPPTFETFMVGGRGIGIENCPGFPNAVITYFSDPTGTVRVLTVMAYVEDRLELVSDSNLDGTPDQVILEGDIPTLKEPGRAEQIAFTMVVLCAGRLETR